MGGEPQDGGGDLEPPSVGRIVRLLEAGLRQDASEREQGRRADRKKEHRDWASLLILLAYTVVTGWILSAQLDANRISTRNFDAQNRAWVHVAGVKIAFDPRSTLASPAFVLDAILENVGSAPAFDVGPRFEVVAGVAPLPAQAALCGDFRKRNRSRSVVFPHSPFLDQHRTLRVQERVPGSSDMGVAYLIGCIDYATKPDGEHRQTQVLRTIVGKDHDAPATFPAFMAEGASLIAENNLPEQAD